MNAASIFIVEDEALIAMEIADRLTDLGYDIVGTAGSADEALTLLRERTPDLVLADIKLAHGRSGIDLAVELKELYADLPVVFLTAYSDDEIVARATVAEPAGFLVKPFDERELNATIQVALRRAEAARQRVDESSDRHELTKSVLDARRDAALDRVAAGVAHTFSGSLQAILGYLEFARDSIPDQEECRKNLDDAREQALLAAERVQLLRRYARGQMSVSHEADLGELCRGVGRALEPSMPDGVHLHVLETPVEPRAIVDVDLILAALTELVLNARDAIEQGGTIQLSVERIRIEQLSECRIHPRGWDGGGHEAASITVRDSGRGIGVDQLEDVFDPFYSTKLLGRGLGLAVVVAAARSAGGAVAVESRIGTGSTFRLIVPLQDVEVLP